MSTQSDMRLVGSGTMQVPYEEYERACRYCGRTFRWLHWPDRIPKGTKVRWRQNCDEHRGFRPPDGFVTLRKGRGEANAVRMGVTSVATARRIVLQVLREAVVETGAAVAAAELVRRVWLLKVDDKDVARSLGRMCRVDRQAQVQLVRHLRALKAEGKIGMDGSTKEAVWYPEALED